MRLGYADGEWVCCRGGLFVGFNGTRLRLKVPRRNFNGTRLRLKVCDPSLLYGEPANGVNVRERWRKNVYIYIMWLESVRTRVCTQ